jgi:hypothetical protein
MVGHETESVNAVPKTTNPFLKQEVETVSVAFSDKNGLTAVTPENDVVKSAGEMDAWFASHVETIPLSLQLVNLEA